MFADVSRRDIAKFAKTFSQYLWQVFNGRSQIVIRINWHGKELYLLDDLAILKELLYYEKLATIRALRALMMHGSKYQGASRPDGRRATRDGECALHCLKYYTLFFIKKYQY